MISRDSTIGDLLKNPIGHDVLSRLTLFGGVDERFIDNPLSRSVKLKALPTFDKDQGAIYLHEMEVVDATVTPEKMQTVLQTVMPYLNQSLRNYFNQRPAYVLKEDSTKGEALAKKYAKGIEVKPGEIVIPFTN